MLEESQKNNNYGEDISEEVFGEIYEGVYEEIWGKEISEEILEKILGNFFDESLDYYYPNFMKILNRDFQKYFKEFLSKSF